MRRSLLLIFLGFALVTVRTAHGLVPFARLSTTIPGLVHYLSPGIMIGTKIPAKFKYLPEPGTHGTPETGFGSEDASFSFTAARIGPADDLLGFGVQRLRLFSFSVTLETPIYGKSNLLSGTASGGELKGLLGSNAAVFQSNSADGASLSYSSDFLVFPNGDDAGLNWVLTGVSPSLAINGSNYRAFNASLTGDFDYGRAPLANVPEGSSFLLFVAGLLPVAWIVYWRRVQARSIRGFSSACSTSRSGSCSAL